MCLRCDAEMDQPLHPAFLFSRRIHKSQQIQQQHVKGKRAVGGSGTLILQ